MAQLSPRVNSMRFMHDRHIILCLAFLGLIFAVMRLIYALLPPSITQLPQFRLDSASFSIHNNTTTSFSDSKSNNNLTATFLFPLRVINPNANAAVSYRQIYTALFNGRFTKSMIRGETLAKPLDVARIPSFRQEGLGDSILLLRFDLVNEYVGEEMEKGLTTGSLSFGLQVKTVIELEKVYYRSEYRINCDKLRLGISSHEGTWSMIGPSKKCDLD